MPDKVYKKFCVSYICTERGIIFKYKISTCLIMNIDMDLVSGLDQYHLYNYFVSELKVQSGRQDAELLSISKLN